MQRRFIQTTSGESFSINDKADDSEEEPDVTFLNDYEEKLIDDISGVDIQEKIFMKLWNAHILRYQVCHVPFLKICLDFVREFKGSLAELRPQWVLHLANLLEFNILTADDVLYLQVYFNLNCG
jgi:hypothetical protein